VSIPERIAGGLPEPAFYRAVSWLNYIGEPEVRLVRDLVPPHTTAVDVGAWYGPWAYWLARVAEHVEAIEPVPDVARFLERVLPKNTTVTCVALSNRDGDAELYVPVGGRGAEGLASLLPPPPGTARTLPITVPVRRLDQLGFTNVGFVKIDVEGHELEVLEGAQKVLECYKPTVVIEIEQRFHDRPIEEVFRVFEDYGYAGWFRDGVHWRSVDDFSVEHHQLRHLEQIQAHGYISNALHGNRGYVNNFLFTAKGPLRSRRHR
jgi:FkbM family methyltransferase